MQRERQRSGAALIRDRHGLERSRVCSASFRCASCRAAPGTREHSETRSRSREWDVLQSRVVAFPCFRPVPACYRRPNRATHATPPARISRLHPAAYGQRRRGRLWPAACFSPVIYREKQGREGRVRTLPMPHCITTSRVSAGARSRDSFRMALLPLFRSRTHEVELERRIYALQAALDQCKDVVDAHMWFNLAAARFPANDTRNRTAAVKNRDTVAGEMSSEQLAEAQKRAREWKPRS